MTGDEPTGAGGSGDARVDDALRRLDDLDGLPLTDHVERYERVHTDLQDTLNAVEQE
jgi:hypothetical protein